LKSEVLAPRAFRVSLLFLNKNSSSLKGDREMSEKQMEDHIHAGQLFLYSLLGVTAFILSILFIFDLSPEEDLLLALKIVIPMFIIIGIALFLAGIHARRKAFSKKMAEEESRQM
jgi:hypothetical protein